MESKLLTFMIIMDNRFDEISNCFAKYIKIKIANYVILAILFINMRIFNFN